MNLFTSMSHIFGHIIICNQAAAELVVGILCIEYMGVSLVPSLHTKARSGNWE